MLNLHEKIFESNENEHLNIFNIFLSLISVVFIRTFLENFSSPHISGYYIPPYALFVHYLYFYFSLLFSLIILLHFFTKVTLTKLVSITIKLFPIIWLPPIFDLIITAGKGWKMSYLFLSPVQLINDFFSFFGPLTKTGITPGMRIEIATILLLIYLYIQYKTNSSLRATIGTICAYIIFFIYLALPSLIMIFYANDSSNIFLFLNSIYKGSLLGVQQSIVGTTINQSYILTLEHVFNIFMARFFWIIIFFQLLLILFIYNKDVFITWIKNSRWERVLYYILIALLGFGIYFHTENNITAYNVIDLVGIIVFLILIAINFWIAVIINDFTDINIDKISNINRPLAMEKISKKELTSIGAVLGIFGITGVVLLPYISLVSLLLFQFSYFIYSSHPLRFKKTFFTSSLLLGLNALVLAVGGFFLISRDQHLTFFPSTFIWLIFIGFSILSNVKDIKDFEGDKLEKIYTLPVIFGLKNGKLIISFICFLFVMLFPLLLEKYFLATATIVPALLFLFLINKKNYEEHKVFYLFYFYFFLLIISFSK